MLLSVGNELKLKQKKMCLEELTGKSSDHLFVINKIDNNRFNCPCNSGLLIKETSVIRKNFV